MSRRGFLASSVAIVPPLLAAGATGYALATNGDFRIQRLRLPLAGLPAELEGFRIAQVSDLHVGHWATDEFLHNVIRSTNALNADVVLFTGDLIDMSITELPRALEVARQWRARLGVFAIEGNHDLIDDPTGFHNQMYASGLPFLRDSTYTLDHGVPLQLLGIPWTRSLDAMTRDVQRIAARRDPGAYPILLAHHPHAFDAAAAAGLPLTLSGHTHGGQIALIPGMSVGRLVFKYISGLYQKPGAKLLVSNGTGNWFPLRINVPAEIIEITLTRA
jgi:predicted MPP superfamily phosphohydrolase